MTMYQDQSTTRTAGPATARLFLHNIRHGKGGSQGRLVIVVSVAAVALAVAAITLLVLTRNSTAAQISQMQQELTAEQAKVAALSQAESGNTGQLHGMSGKISTIDNALTYLGQFDQSCTQDFTGPNGPAEYWFLCANHAPAG